MNIKRNRIVLAVAVIVALIVGVNVGYAVASHRDSQADITVLPCSAWAATSHPVIAPYTFTGACALPDGSLSLPTK